MIVVVVIGNIEDRTVFLNKVKDKYGITPEEVERVNSTISCFGIVALNLKVDNKDLLLKFFSNNQRWKKPYDRYLYYADAIIKLTPDYALKLNLDLSQFRTKLYEVTHDSSIEEILLAIITTCNQANISNQYEVSFWKNPDQPTEGSIPSDEQLLVNIKLQTKLPKNKPEERSKVIIDSLHDISKLSVSKNEKWVYALEKMMDYYTLLVKEDAVVLIPELEKLSEERSFKFLHKVIATRHEEAITPFQIIVNNINVNTQEATSPPFSI